MKEELLHFIWQSKTLTKESLRTITGETLQIIHPGIWNTDAGPDFFNAKVRIGDTLWAGNIEIHLKSSDWKAHQHHKNKAYNTVILHVVYHYDKEIHYDKGNPIPTLELREIISPLMLRKYHHLQLNQNTIACEKIFQLPPAPQFTAWMERLLVERLQEKCEHIETLLTQNKYHWEQVFYMLTARYFGMKTNAQPFEWLARWLPLQVLAKHKNNLTQIEALVFGVAGFLEEDHEDSYLGLMKREFTFLQKKYDLKALDKSTWKFARTRPANFPTVRLAQFAMLIYNSSHLFSKVLEGESIDELIKLYTIKPNEHLSPFFFRGTQTRSYALGRLAMESLLMNTVLPVLFLYGKHTHQPELSERAFHFYEELKAEENAVVAFWESLGIEVKSSFESQALLQLKNNYCEKLKCLSCIIGREIVLSKHEQTDHTSFNIGHDRKPDGFSPT